MTDGEKLWRVIYKWALPLPLWGLEDWPGIHIESLSAQKYSWIILLVPNGFWFLTSEIVAPETQIIAPFCSALRQLKLNWLNYPSLIWQFFSVFRFVIGACLLCEDKFSQWIFKVNIQCKYTKMLRQWWIMTFLLPVNNLFCCIVWGKLSAMFCRHVLRSFSLLVKKQSVINSKIKQVVKSSQHCG